MKQRICISLIGLLWAAMLLSCKTGTEPETDPEITVPAEEATLEVSASEHQFAAGNQLSFAVTVKSNYPFTATSSQEWCTTEIIGDKATNNLIISVAENSSVDPRIATVTITTANDGQQRTLPVAVSQSGIRPSLSIEEGAVYITGEGEEFTVHVTANFPVTFAFPSWISQKSTGDDGTYTFVVGALPASIESRKDSLTVKAVNPAVTATAAIPVTQTVVTALNVMTCNIYLASGDKLNWNSRRASMVKFIRLADVDILGTQETEYTQHEFLRTNMTEYAAYGAGRDNGRTSGEHNTIFYRKGRFTEHGSGTFWLSSTPDIPGKGWDAGYTRIASWVILADKISGRRIFVINTHIDHIGPEAQRNSIPLLMSKISELHGDLPVVLTGDFNMPPTNNNIRYITDASAGHYSLLHARAIADTEEGHTGTYHNLRDADPGIGWQIDFIFVSEDVHALHYTVFPPRFEGSYLSDHSAVMTKINIRQVFNGRYG